MQRLVRRGLVLLGASTIAIGLAVPANASTRHPAPADTITQRQDAEVSNQTKQTAIAIAPAVQVAPATNVGVLTFGGQSIWQANNNKADATAVNANLTKQRLTQTQHARKPIDGKKAHGGKGHDGKKCHARGIHADKTGHPGKSQHARKGHDGTRHAGKGTSQRQTGSVSNRTKQTAVAIAPAVQVAPATNVGVLTFGGQSIKQANHNDADASAVNLNATDQDLTQGQFADG